MILVDWQIQQRHECTGVERMNFEVLTTIEDELNGKRPIEKTQHLREAVEGAVDEFFREDTPTENYLRMSSLGKPMVVQGMSKLMRLNGVEAKDFPGSVQAAFLTGHVMEAWILETGRQLGLWSVAEKQTEIEYRGVKGHVDAIVELYDSSLVVLEIKTMSPSYFAQFKKLNGFCDERGYFSQACMYSHATKLPVVWVCWNKAFSKYSVIPLSGDLDLLGDTLVRANYIIDRMPRVNDVASLLENFPTPKPVDELVRGVPTGNLLIPKNFRYEPYAHLFYKTERGLDKYSKEQTYVLGVEDKEVVRELLEYYLTR